MRVLSVNVTLGGVKHFSRSYVLYEAFTGKRFTSNDTSRKIKKNSGKKYIKKKNYDGLWLEGLYA